MIILIIILTNPNILKPLSVGLETAGDHSGQLSSDQPTYHCHRLLLTKLHVQRLRGCDR